MATPTATAPVPQPSPVEIPFTDVDYPALFCVADAASSKAQRQYLLLKTADLVTLVLAAALAVGAGAVQNLAQYYQLGGGAGMPAEAARGAAQQWQQVQQIVIFLCAVFVGIGLIMTTLLRQFSFERDWYGGRAVAESVKTRTWRYLMGSDPYRRDAGDAGDAAADARFLKDLRDFLSQNGELSLDMGVNRGSEHQITERMRAIRALPTDVRKALYLRQRVEDQLNWYQRKARRNRTLGDRWFLAVIATQILALVTALWRILDTNLPEYTAVFATLAAAFLAWLQLKQHQALSQAYTAAYLDLGFALDAADGVRTDDELAAYVADTESAVSREHTSWLARTNH